MDHYHKDYLVFDKGRAVVWREIAGYLKKWIPKGTAALELGAGYCDFINVLDFPQKMAIDIWPEFTKYAGNEVVCHVLDVRKINVGKFKNKFDLIMASNLLEHLTIDEVNKLLSDCRKILSQNGKLILIQPNFTYSYQHYFDDYTHKSIFTETSLCSVLVQNKYKIVHVEPRFLPLTVKSRFPKWRILVRLYLSLPIRPMAGQMLIIASFKAGP